jgi:hypothetical protein
MSERIGSEPARDWYLTARRFGAIVHTGGPRCQRGFCYLGEFGVVAVYDTGPCGLRDAVTVRFLEEVQRQGITALGRATYAEGLVNAVCTRTVILEAPEERVAGLLQTYHRVLVDVTGRREAEREEVSPEEDL